MYKGISSFKEFFFIGVSIMSAVLSVNLVLIYSTYSGKPISKAFLKSTATVSGNTSDVLIFQNSEIN